MGNGDEASLEGWKFCGRGLIQLTGRNNYRNAGLKAGLKFDYIYQMDELVNSDNTFFVATGVTDGPLVSGVRKKGDLILAESIVIRGKTGTVRKVFAEYQASRWI
jgi:fructose-1,6-bisphosphatase II